MQNQLRTLLYNIHVSKGAKIVEFAGWLMPLWYSGTTGEVLAVRNNAGLFDVSHMGRFIIEGPDAENLLQYVTTNNVSKLTPGRAHYTTLTNEKGGIKDDEVILRIGEERFIEVTNAATREKIWGWVNKIAEERGFNVKFSDETFNSTMLALQGPKSVEIMGRLAGANVSNMKRFRVSLVEIAGFERVVSKTGYTGEAGFEIISLGEEPGNPEKTLKLIEEIERVGEDYGLKFCGLSARDILRLEAGMILYDNDADETTTPFEANISFVVKLDKGDFIGREALARQAEEGVKRLRVGLKMFGKSIARHGYKVYSQDGREIGVITSGNYSPIVGCGIAMAYLPVEYSKIGVKVKVEIRGRMEEAVVHKMPFYDESKYGWRRSA